MNNNVKTLEQVMEFMDRVEYAHDQWCYHSVPNMDLEWNRLLDEFWDFCKDITDEEILDYIQKRIEQ